METAVPATSLARIRVAERAFWRGSEETSACREVLVARRRRCLRLRRVRDEGVRWGRGVFSGKILTGV